MNIELQQVALHTKRMKTLFQLGIRRLTKQKFDAQTAAINAAHDPVAVQEKRDAR